MKRYNDIKNWLDMDYEEIIKFIKWFKKTNYGYYKKLLSAFISVNHKKLYFFILLTYNYYVEHNEPKYKIKEYSKIYFHASQFEKSNTNNNDRWIQDILEDISCVPSSSGTTDSDIREEPTDNRGSKPAWIRKGSSSNIADDMNSLNNLNKNTFLSKYDYKKGLGRLK